MAAGAPVGRFAPSPTGALHFGSLVAAAGSYLNARAASGRWLVRIEDIDRPRCLPGAADSIRRSLERLELNPDGEIRFQHARRDRYLDALSALKQSGDAFGCRCTRRMLADAPRTADGSPRYPGTCRQGLPPGTRARTWRMRVAGEIDFTDLICGPHHEHLPTSCGDFVLLRGDGVIAYQLAVVIDDADSGITEVVRGADLLYSTARQIYLQRRLGLPTPRYAHLPIALGRNGAKLSKQTMARAIDEIPPTQAVFAALRFLGQSPPAELQGARPAELWNWAIAHWQLARVPSGQQPVIGTPFDDPATA